MTMNPHDAVAIVRLVATAVTSVASWTLVALSDANVTALIQAGGFVFSTAITALGAYLAVRMARDAKARKNGKNGKEDESDE